MRKRRQKEQREGPETEGNQTGKSSNREEGQTTQSALTGCWKSNFSKAAQKCPDARPPCLRRSGFAQAGEILSSRSDKRRVLEVVRLNKPAPCLTRGRMRGVGDTYALMTVLLISLMSYFLTSP